MIVMTLMIMMILNEYDNIDDNDEDDIWIMMMIIIIFILIFRQIPSRRSSLSVMSEMQMEADKEKSRIIAMFSHKPSQVIGLTCQTKPGHQPHLLTTDWS